jgi:hypothetical protein
VANDNLVLEDISWNGCRNGGYVVVVIGHSSGAELWLCEGSWASVLVSLGSPAWKPHTVFGLVLRLKTPPA